MHYVLWEMLPDGQENLHLEEGQAAIFSSEGDANAAAEEADYDDWYAKVIISGHPMVAQNDLGQWAISLHDYFVATGQEHACPEKCRRYE